MFDAQGAVIGESGFCAVCNVKGGDLLIFAFYLLLFIQLVNYLILLCWCNSNLARRTKCNLGQRSMLVAGRFVELPQVVEFHLVALALESAPSADTVGVHTL